MEVKPGYKQTEVGAIPEEWGIISLQSLVTRHNSGVYKKRELYGSGYNIIGVSGLYDIHSVNGQTFASVPMSEQERAKYTLKDSDLLYGESSLVREGIARTVYVTSRGAGTAFAWHTRRYSINLKRVLPAYLYYYLQSRLARKHMMDQCIQTAITGINTLSYFACPVLCPPLSEQRAIAGALSDVDALINALGSVLAKKRDLKKAALQQFITGQIRLPGFSGEWETKRLGELGSFSKGRGLAKEDLSSSGSLPAIPYTAIYTDHDEILQLANVRYFADRASGCEVISGPRLLIASSSNMLENIGKATAFSGGAEIAVGGDILLYETKADVHFLSYLLSTRLHRSRVVRLSQGSTIRHVYASTFQSYSLSLPPLPEQVAIAAVLSDIDDEIAALQARLAKMGSLKQGMMQELLTGRTRLA